MFNCTAAFFSHLPALCPVGIFSVPATPAQPTHFSANFDLHWINTLVPALLIIAFHCTSVSQPRTMAASSIITGSLLCLFLQDTTPPKFGSIMFYVAFTPADQQLAQILSGGGIITLTVSVIIILSSAYAGIFKQQAFE